MNGAENSYATIPGYYDLEGKSFFREMLIYQGKTIDFEKYSPCHRTMVAHFLHKGK